MAILSPSKARRLRTHRGKTTQQVIVFQMQRDWFALPIFAVKKVVPKSEIQGNYYSSGAGLTIYEGRELLILDIHYQVFGNRRNQTSSSDLLADAPALESAESLDSLSTEGYLLIVRNRQEELVGLPVISSPTVRRVAQSDIVPLPPNYAARVNIQFVSGLIVQTDGHPILFLLNPDQLLHTHPLLPPSF